MASNLDIPQFGTGATPGLNAPRMQAIWTFLKSIALGGSGSVIKADNATQLAATTPSAVGLSMLSATDKAAQQALVSLPEVSSEGLVAHWSMDSVPEIPDDPAGVTYLQDAWLSYAEWDSSQSTRSIVNGSLRVTTSAGATDPYSILTIAYTAPKTIKLKVRGSKSGNIKIREGGAAPLDTTITLTTDWQLINLPTLTSGGVSYIIIFAQGFLTSGDWLEIDFIYIGTGAYLPNSLIDNSGNGHHGTIYGATPATGISGKALAFDGENDYVSIPQCIPSGAFSMGAIIKRDVLTYGYEADFGIIGTYIDGTAGNRKAVLVNRYVGGKNYIYAYIVAADNTTILTVDGPEWNVVAGQYYDIKVIFIPSVSATIYINGAMYRTVTTSITSTHPSTQPVLIGKAVSTNHFSGTIDEPRIYNRALTAEEVYSLYMSKGRGPDAQAKSVRGVANSLVVRNASGQLQDMADYGIGTEAPLIITNLNTVLKGGIYAYGTGATGSPLGTSAGQLFVEPYGSSISFQKAKAIISANTVREWVRILTGGGGNWFEVWNSVSDGNGGQPPAPKPRTTSGAGQFTTAVYVNPDTKVPADGTWLVINYDDATGLWNAPAIYAGGTTLAGSANIPTKYLCWRISA